MALHAVCMLEVFEIKNGLGDLLLTGKSGVLLIEITQTGTDCCHYPFSFFFLERRLWAIDLMRNKAINGYSGVEILNCYIWEIGRVSLCEHLLLPLICDTVNKVIEVP